MSQSEDEPPEGTLYFNSVSTPFMYTPGTDTAQSIAICQGTRVESYGMVIAAPTGTASSKNYASAGGAASCSTRFEYKFEADTVLSGAATVSTFAACDVASANYDGFSGRLAKVVGTTATTISSADGEVTNTPTTCGTTAFPVKFTINLVSGAAPRTFKAGEILRLSLWAWYPTPTQTAAKNLHYLVGSATHSSSISIPGLPLGASAPVAAPQINLSATPANGEAEPGGSATFTVSLSNGGKAAANVSLNATTDATVEFENETVSVAAGENATTTATVTVPAEAMPGEEYAVTIHAAVGDQSVANTTVTVVVVAAGTNPTTSTGATTDANATDPNATANKADDGGDSPGLPFVAALAASLAVAVWVRRRRQG